MRINSLDPLREFWHQPPDADEPLRQWFKTVQQAEWRNLYDVREMYPHPDPVGTQTSGTLTVFNIRGGHHELITRIRYYVQLVDVRTVPTSRGTDRGHWKE